MPKTEIIEAGKTVDAAIDSACEKLGCSRDDCEWEIIDLPKRGFLGLKNTPARVRVSVTTPEPPKPAEKPATPVRTEQPRAYQAPKAPRIQQEPKAPLETANQKADTPPTRPSASTQRPRREREPASAQAISEKTELAKAYLFEILSKMDLPAELSSSEEDGGICVNIEGKGLGAIIGRRGETLDAIQYLTSLVANRSDGDYVRVTIDCGDYRMKRKETLEALAKKLAAQVKKTNASRTLEPMNPFERRIIHATVSEIEGVTSISTGEEPNRRVVITTPSARTRGGRGNYARDSRNQGETDSFASKPPRERDSGRRERNFDNKPPRNRTDRDSQDRPGQQSIRQPSAPAPVRSQTPKKTPEAESTNKPLYAKIDLE